MANGRRTAYLARSGPVPLLLAAGLIILAGCAPEAETRAPEPKEVPCRTAVVNLRDVPAELSAVGSLEAATTVMVATRMMGWVRKIHATAGQAVTKGDPLVTIDDSDLQAKKTQAEAGIREAKAVLANAEKMAARFENLYADKSVSRQQLDDVLTGRDRAAAGLAMAQAALSEVEVHLSYLDITAPMDGTVGRRMVDEGDMANPGMPLMILEDVSTMKVVAHVGEKDISSVKVGDPARVAVTSLPDAVYEATVSKIIPTANPGSRTYDIEALLDNADRRLRSGMFARVSLQGPASPRLRVPAAAVIRRGQLTGVWLVDSDQTAHLRWVRLGHTYDDQVEILSGLQGGETLVLEADLPLAEGDKVVN